MTDTWKVRALANQLGAAVSSVCDRLESFQENEMRRLILLEVQDSEQKARIRELEEQVEVLRTELMIEKKVDAKLKRRGLAEKEAHSEQADP